MRIFPAIDIKDKKVVRLSMGDYASAKAYSLDPLEVALDFEKRGVEYLHVVDLDGAKDASTVNFDVVRNIVGNTSLKVEIGGGIRDEERIKKYLDCGVWRVILGTAAVKNRDFTLEMIKKYGDKIAVGVDAKNGEVAVEGWLEGSGVDAYTLCKMLFENGVSEIIYTDISRDGMLSGCPADFYKRLIELENSSVVASGGVASVEDIRALKAAGCSGVIIGKAIYEGRISLEEAIKEASEE